MEPATPLLPFAQAVALLRGTAANYYLCYASMLASFGAGIAGIVQMTLESENGVWKLTSHPLLAGESLLFLIAQSFTLAKVTRDIITFEPGHLARPTTGYIFSVFFFWGLALVCSLYSIVTVTIDPVWRSFLSMDLIWVTVSTMCLSKVVRDRDDAQSFLGVPPDEQERGLTNMATIIKGTVMYKLFVWFAALSSISMMLGLMWSWPAQTLKIQYKELISVCMLWCEYSAFHFAKLMRDREDSVKARELKRQIPFQLLVVASMFASFGVMVANIIMLPLGTAKTAFMLTGSGFSLTAAFFLAKHVRDGQELHALNP